MTVRNRHYRSSALFPVGPGSPDSPGAASNPRRPALHRTRRTPAVPLTAAAAAAAGLGWLPHVPCWFRTATGMPCPFCGLTRSLAAAVAGDWAAAARCYPLLLFAWIGAALFAAGWAARGCGWRAPADLARRAANRPTAVWGVLGGLVAANWVYRLLFGMD